MQMCQFEKMDIPSNSEEPVVLAEKPVKFGVSLMQYTSAIKIEDVTMYVLKF